MECHLKRITQPLVLLSMYASYFFPIITTGVALEIAEEFKTSTKYVGTRRLVLTDNYHKHHTYDIQEYVYDSESPINIIGVPYIGKHFGDQSTGLYEDDGTTVKSGSIKSYFVWDHDNHECHFMHG